MNMDKIQILNEFNTIKFTCLHYKLDKCTYMRVNWGRSYELLAKSLELSRLTKHVHYLFAQNRVEHQNYGGQNVIDKIFDL